MCVCKVIETYAPHVYIFLLLLYFELFRRSVPSFCSCLSDAVRSVRAQAFVDSYFILWIVNSAFACCFFGIHTHRGTYIHTCVSICIPHYIVSPFWCFPLNPSLRIHTVIERERQKQTCARSIAHFVLYFSFSFLFLSNFTFYHILYFSLSIHHEHAHTSTIFEETKNNKEKSPHREKRNNKQC